MSSSILKTTWEYALSTNDPEGTFLESIKKITQDEAEARRIFWAQQIANKQFVEKQLKPSEMAIKLSAEIQELTQKNTRDDLTQEEVIIEFLNYYFPEGEAMNNFQVVLEGKLDEVDLPDNHYPKQKLSEEELEANTPIFEDEKEEGVKKTEEYKEKMKQSAENKNLEEEEISASIETDFQEEIFDELKNIDRSKLKQYLDQNSLEKKSVQVRRLLPKKVQEIVDQYLDQV